MWSWHWSPLTQTSLLLSPSDELSSFLETTLTNGVKVVDKVITHINSFQVNCFFINNIKIHSFTSLTGVGALQGNFGTITGVQLKLRKHPNAYIAIKWNLNLLVITFSTTLTPLVRVVSRNDASSSDGDNKRLVCVRGDQCHADVFFS
jgi:hypothetical protein